jgi:hypothetical protein
VTILTSWTSYLKRRKVMGIFEEWKELQKDLKRIKAREMELRKEICANILEGIELPASKKLEHAGERITAKQTLSYAIDESTLNTMWADLSNEEQSAIRFKPNLAMREYKKLPEDSILHEAVTCKPAAPTLKVEAI